LHCSAEQVTVSPAITKVLKIASELMLQMLEYLGSPGNGPKFLALTHRTLTLNLTSFDGSFRINIGKGLL
jgi:hypothetical protein